MDCQLCAKTKHVSARNRRGRNIRRRRRRAYLRALLSGYKWDTRSLTYGFQEGWDETQKANIVKGIGSWEKVCGLTFTLTSFSEASLKFHLVTDTRYPYLGHAYYPVGRNKGKIYISYHNALDKTFRVGGYDYITIIHEIGHALGLAHTHDGIKFPGVKNPTHGGLNNQNVILNTVMGYNDLKGPLTSRRRTNYGFVAGPMAYDVNAIQHLYGRPAKEIENNTYTMDQPYFENIVDTGGVDTIVSTSARNTRIDLRPATVDGRRATGGGAASYQQGVKGGFTISKGTTIENAATGSGNDVLRGNHASNTLVSGAGNDTFIASGGTDYFYGGPGRDKVLFQGPRRMYRIQKLGKGQYKVIGRGKFRRISGVSFLFGIERARFRGRWITLS